MESKYESKPQMNDVTKSKIPQIIGIPQKILNSQKLIHVNMSQVHHAPTN